MTPDIMQVSQLALNISTLIIVVKIAMDYSQMKLKVETIWKWLLYNKIERD